MKLKANGIEIEYEIKGSGEPLVLIAGLGYSRWCWHRVVDGLAEHYQVITFDNRGVGGTTRTEGQYTAELLADDTAALLDGLGIKQANICGISMGGFIAQALTIRRPDLFKRLILMSTGFGGPRQIPPPPEMIAKLKDTTMDPRSRALLSVAPGFENREPEFFDEWMESRALHTATPAGYLSQLAIGLRLLSGEHSFEEKLSSIRVPSLIVFGELDRLIPAANADLLQAAIPGSQKIVFEKIGHYLPFEAPKQVVDAIVRFTH